MTVKARLDASRHDITSRYLAGESTVSLGSAYGCNGGSIWLALKRWGVPIRATKVADANRDRVLELDTAGVTAYAIEKQLGISDATVSRILKAAGRDISARKKGRADPLVNHSDAIIARYQAGEGCDLIAADFGCQRTSIMRLLTRAGVEMRTVRDYAYPVDESFFDAIDTEEKAYTLGFWMADGCNQEHVPCIRLSITDECILRRMMRAMRFEGVVATMQPRGKGRLVQHSVCIGSRRLSEALAKAGCGRGKTYMATFPGEDIVQPELVRHLVRGWMDGDGTITHKPGRRHWHMRIVGTEAVCRGLSAACQAHLGFPGSVCPVHRGASHTTWGFTVGGREKLAQYLGWLYRDATIFLARKHAKYREFLSATS